MKIRIKNVSDIHGKEYWVETLHPFDEWITRAVVFNYKLARRIAKMLKKDGP